MALAVPSLARIAPSESTLPALSLGLGCSFLIAWLRRADRRAGALAGVGFGALFLRGFDALAALGVLFFVLASRPRQRRFALSWAGSATALAWLAAWLHGQPLAQPRRRLFLAEELLYQLEGWSLAWLGVLAAGALGALAFPWRGEPWRPGAIEEPRHEALALLVLIALVLAALAVPFSPWSEGEALALVFAPCALLAGLLSIPPARV
jgi:hypothetical protein